MRDEGGFRLLFERNPLPIRAYDVALARLLGEIDRPLARPGS